jgi:hypothetical protein
MWRCLFSNEAMKHCSMNTYGEWGVDVYLHLFLTSALDGNEWSALPPAASSFEKDPQYISVWGWMRPRVDLCSVRERNPVFQLGSWPRFLGRPAPILVTILTELFRLSGEVGTTICFLIWGPEIFETCPLLFRQLIVCTVKKIYCAERHGHLLFSFDSGNLVLSWLGIWNSFGRYSVNICRKEATYENNFQVKYLRCVFNN